MKRAALETEYGEPLYDICHGFAEMGYSRSDTARCLGYSEGHFLRCVLPEVDPDGLIPWPSRGYSNAHREALHRRSQDWVWRESLRQSRRRWAVWVEIGGQRMTVADAARLPGVTVAAQTIAKRWRRGVRGDALIAPPMPRAERGRLGLAGRIPADAHPWRAAA